MEYLVMLPGPTNVPNRVMNAMLAPVINHRSEDFRILYRGIIEKTQKVFETNGDIILLTTSGTGAVESSVVNLIKKGDKAIIPVNGEFSNRLADLIDSWGGTAIRYMDKLGDLCGKYGSFFIADAVSILGGDELPVDKWNVDICITASQKALAAPPGVSPISINERT